MGKVDRKGNTKGDTKHVRLHRWMLKSAAWKHLSLAGRCLLIELYNRYNGENNGQIIMSVREAAMLLSVCNDTVLKAFRELEAKGFLRPNEKGSFSLKVRHASTWILTEFPYANQLPTKEFMSWEPESEKQKPVRRNRTDSTIKSNRGAATVRSNRTDGTTKSDREHVLEPGHGTMKSNTISLPREGGPPEQQIDHDPRRAAPRESAEPDEGPVPPDGGQDTEQEHDRAPDGDRGENVGDPLPDNDPVTDAIEGEYGDEQPVPAPPPATIDELTEIPDFLRRTAA